MSILWFSEVSRKDIPFIGNKAAHLVELYNNNFPIPIGFVITSDVFKWFLEESKTEDEIYNILNKLDIKDNTASQNASKNIKEIILNQKFPDYLREEILEAYENLSVNKELFKNAQQALDIVKAGRDFPFVAIRGSIVDTILEDQPTLLNIKGNSNLIKAIQTCWALFFDVKSLPNLKDSADIQLAVIIQKQIQSQKSGIVFSKNILNNNKDEILIEAGFGLAESIILNQINSDRYLIDKESLKIKNMEINEQDFEYILDINLGHTIKRNLAKERREQQVLNGYEIVKLAELTKKVEDYYEKPLDIEFAIEGNNLYVLQVKPVNTLKKVKIVKEAGDLKETEQRVKQEAKKEDFLYFKLGDINIALPKNRNNIDIIIRILESLKENGRA